MDYLFYSLIALAVLAICLLIARMPGRARLAGRPEDLAERQQKHRAQQDLRSALDELPRNRAVLQRDLRKVPTPWGWPGSDLRHGPETPGASGSLRDWIGHLVAEKRTVEDDEYRLHNSEALRFMMEDRFGQAAQPSRMKYRKVKPPRLADPSRPYDQMDNFPSGRTDAIVSKLSKQPREAAADPSDTPVRKAVGLENIKKPWGW